MDFGSGDIRDPLVLSPMVDVTDAPFRMLAKECGADITCTEMISAKGLLFENARSWDLTRKFDGELPYGVQIMGPDAESITGAIAMLAERSKPDYLDLNLGCPSPNILRSESGAFLLRDPERTAGILARAREACDSAGIAKCSIKIRLGHSTEQFTYLDLARVAEDVGMDWMTVHGRTVVQGYSGESDWGRIAEVVRATAIPVIGNGDLRLPEDPARMREETDCAGFFIARAAMHDPTVFARMRAHLDGKPIPDAPEMAERMQLFARYMDLASEFGLDDVANLRRQGTRFASGARGAKEMRKGMHAAKTVAELRAFVAGLT